MANPAEDEAAAALRQSLNASISAWSKFDLESRRPGLEKSAAAAREHRDQSQAARKTLGELTKSFKKSVKGAEASAAVLRSTPGDGGAAEGLLSSVDELAKSCRSTVKSYQEEIDNLTRRCKASDSAFMELFRSMEGLPDPAPVMCAGLGDLDSRVGQVNHLLKGMEEMHNEMGGVTSENERLRREVEELRREVESARNEAADARKMKSAAEESGGLGREEREELIQLRREVAEYEVEFRGLKNQDITIRKLEKKIEDMQKSSEEEMEKQLKKAREDLAETEGRRAAEALEREAALERKLQSLDLELRAERAGRDAAQATLLEADEGASAREAAWEAQRQILVDDAERLREALQEATAERDGLSLRVAVLQGTEGGTTVGLSGGAAGVVSPPASGVPLGMKEMLAERKAFEAEVSELTVTATSLREELKAKEERTVEEKKTMQVTIDSLQKERISLSATVAQLRTEILNSPSPKTVENMRRELRILKRLEYNAVDADAEKDPEMTTGGRESEDADLESVLVAKLKRVESELVTERREKNERVAECDALRQQLAGAEKARADSDALVAALEEDLERALAAGAPAPSESSQGEAPLMRAPLPLKAKPDPATLQRVLERSESPPPITTDAEVPADTAAPTSSAAEKANDDHSVATIVMAQRDRLRARCDALEAERDSFKRELQIQVASAESLKADNTKLYEKVRYLQNFANNSNATGGGMRSRQAMADRDLDLEALEQRYEASVDPFRQFGRAERQRKLKEMSPMERFVFIIAKIVLGSKEMRTALFFYMCGMHLLVFVTTYHWSHELGCQDLHLHKDLAHFHGAVPFENKHQGLDSAGGAAEGGA